MMLGAAAARGAAAAWALTSILWRRMGDELSPNEMNLAKGLIGSAYLAIILCFVGAHHVGAREFVFLGLSGVLGIAVGDSCYFTSLIGLGPRLATLLGALGPILTAILAVAFLGERPSPAAWLGIFAASGGVAWVLLDGRPGASSNTSSDWARGLRHGLLAVLCSALGMVLAKKGVSSTPALEATSIRVGCGAGALLLWGAVQGRAGRWLSVLREPRRLGRLCLIVMIATFGGFWLSLVALRRADAWLVGVLLSTTPLLVLPMTAVAFGEKIRFRAVAGTLVAVAGVALALARG
jgi:drug/metabolite transporter (DMT)-like permease